MQFAESTRGTRIDAERWSTPIRDGWDIRGNANGGYLMALCARTMASHAERPDPITVTGHYLAPGKAGAATLRAQTVRAGRQLATVSATLEADGRPLLQLLGSFGDLALRGAFPERIVGGPPALPAPEHCVRMGRDNVMSPALFRERVQLLLHPADAVQMQDQDALEIARLRGWLRLADDEPMDGFALLLACDSFPPTIFKTNLPIGWAPTVELTVHVRARPAPGWLRAQFTHRFASSGFIEEDGEIWDSNDRLVAQSRQLALLPRGEPRGEARGEPRGEARGSPSAMTR